MGIVFNGDDDVIVPFVVEFQNGQIADLTSCTVSAKVFTGDPSHPVINLEPEVAVKIDNRFPVSGQFHGTVKIDGSITAMLRPLSGASLRIVVVNADGNEMSTIDGPLKRMG